VVGVVVGMRIEFDGVRQVASLVGRYGGLLSRARVVRECNRLMEQVALRECVRNFERQGYEDRFGAFHRWASLSPVTVLLSEGAALRKVGGGRVRRGTATTPTVAVGAGGRRRVRRTQHSKALLDTGVLRASLQGGHGFVRREFGDALEVGTRIPYARVLQEGAVVRVTDRMRRGLYARTGVWVRARRFVIPARPFLVVSRYAGELAVKVVREYLEGLLR